MVEAKRRIRFIAAPDPIGERKPRVRPWAARKLAIILADLPPERASSEVQRLQAESLYERRLGFGAIEAL